jgi:hypothetical protein
VGKNLWAAGAIPALHLRAYWFPYGAGSLLAPRSERMRPPLAEGGRLGTEWVGSATPAGGCGSGSEGDEDSLAAGRGRGMPVVPRRT